MAVKEKERGTERQTWSTPSAMKSAGNTSIKSSSLSKAKGKWHLAYGILPLSNQQSNTSSTRRMGG